jgi:hypothetical protein
MRWLLRTFSAAWEAADRSFAEGEGENEYETAAILTAWMITLVIERVMSVEQRELTRAQLEAWSARPEGAEDEAPSDPWARAFALLARQTATMVAMERIRPAVRRIVLMEVTGALDGKTRQERREARLAAAAIRPLSLN